jgi:hypothetical protein
MKNSASTNRQRVKRFFMALTVLTNIKVSVLGNIVRLVILHKTLLFGDSGR